jgi:hypothetical protein
MTEMDITDKQAQGSVADRIQFRQHLMENGYVQVE